MAWRFYNPNPKWLQTTDCVIRAISKLQNMSWSETLMDVTQESLVQCMMPDNDFVWGSYLHKHGYTKHILQHTYPYTVNEFCYDHPYGRYLLKTTGHVIAVVDGDFYDAFDSGDEIPLYYWRKD